MASPPLVTGTQSQASISSANFGGHVEHGPDIPLETLVSHLLASKRSLSSISTVWRANEIVTSAKKALEESVALNARRGFVQDTINQQTKILKGVRNTIERSYNAGQEDFEVSFRSHIDIPADADYGMRRMFFRPLMLQTLDLSLQWVF